MPCATSINGGMRSRVHGDYHLGQVLRTEEDFVILDFEGEPARSLAERRAKQSPLKDVAGMMRSFSYAAYAALFAFIAARARRLRSARAVGRCVAAWMSATFLAEYRATIARLARAHSLLPAPGDFDVLLRAFMLEKALYELAYELNNRPDWVRIPLTGS